MAATIGTRLRRYYVAGILVLAPTALTLWVVWKLFRFFDEQASTLTASGVLPQHDETVGSGRLAITGGTGKFKATRGELVVDSMNPHRWSVD